MRHHPVFQCHGHPHAGNDPELTNILIKSLVFRYLEEQNLVYTQELSVIINEINNKITEFGSVSSDSSINTTPVHPGQVSRPLSSVNNSILYIEDFGGVGDGITDDTEALRKLLSVGGSIALTGGKTYLVTDKSSGIANTYFNGNGATILVDYPNKRTTSAALTFEGGLDETTATICTHVIDKGSYELTVANGVPFNKGDHIKLSSTEYKHGVEGHSGLGVKEKAEYLTIAYVEGNKLYLLEKTKDNYDGRSKKIIKVNFLENVIIDNVKIINKYANATDVSMPESAGARGITVSYVYNYSLINSLVSNFRYIGHEVGNSKNVRVVGNSFYGYDISDPTNGNEGSEWFVGTSGRSVENFLFKDNFGKNLRRPVDVDSHAGEAIFSRNITIEGNNSVNSTHAVGTHACEHVFILNNMGTNCGAIWIRGIDLTITGNSLRHIGNSRAAHQGIRVGYGIMPTFNGDFPLGDLIIKNNIIETSTGTGIAIYGNTDFAIISDNNIKCSTEAISILGNKTNNIKVLNNTLNCSVGAIFRIPNYDYAPRLSCNNISIVGNTFIGTKDGNTRVGITISGSSKENPASNILIENNYFKDISLWAIAINPYSIDEVGYYGKNISIVNNTFDVLEGCIEITQRPTQNTAIHIRDNKEGDRNTFEVASRTDSNYVTFAYGFTYEQGMYMRYPKPVTKGYIGSVCVEKGTLGNTLIGAAKTVAGSNVITNVTHNTPLNIGNYIKLSNSGLPPKTKIIAINGDSYTLSNVVTISNNSSSISWDFPKFEEYGYIGNEYNGWGARGVPQSIIDIDSMENLTGLYQVSSATVSGTLASNLVGALLNLRTGSSHLQQLLIDSAGDMFTRVVGSTTSVWQKMYGNSNTYIGPNGALMPLLGNSVVNLFNNKLDIVKNRGDITGITMTKTGTGKYLLNTSAKLSSSLIKLHTQKDPNNSLYYMTKYSYPDANSVLIETFAPDYTTTKVGYGDPMDIVGSTFISINF